MSELSDEERSLLRHAAIYKAVSEPAANGTSKKWLESLFDPAVFVALITVIGGGIFGTIITAQYQQHAKDRELALLNFQQTNEARLKIAADAYDLIGIVVAAGDDLITTTETSFAQAKDPETRKQVTDLLAAYNVGEKAWREREARTGLLLAYHHDASLDQLGWPAVSTAVRAYVDCARKWHYDHAAGVANVSAACGSQRGNVQIATHGLSINLLKARDALLRKQARLINEPD